MNRTRPGHSRRPSTLARLVRAHRAARERSERGAVIVLTALVALALVLVAGLAVDIGVQRVARTDMQSVADVVALDVARELDCRTEAELGDVQALADASLARNPGTVGTGPMVTPELGTIDDAGNFIALTQPTDVPGAVRVRAQTTVRFAFGVMASGPAGRVSVARGNDDCATPTCSGTACGPQTTPGSTPTSTTGATPCSGSTCAATPTRTPTTPPVPRSQPAGCMRVGSSVLEAGTSSSVVVRNLLNVGLGARAGVLDYNSLTGAQVGLDYLAKALGRTSTGALAGALDAGSTDALLASTVTAPQLALALATASASDPDPSNDATARVLGAVTTASAGPPAATFTLGSILSVAAGGAPSRAAVDVLSLLTAAATVANGTNALTLPISAPGVTAELVLGDAPRQACGSAVASTSQLMVRLTQTVNLVRYEVTLDLGKAVAGVSAVSCANDTPTTMRVHLDQSTAGALTARLTSALASVVVPGSAPTTGAAGIYALPLPSSFTTPYRVPGNGTLGAPEATTAQVALLGLSTSASLALPGINQNLKSLTDALTTQVGPLLDLQLGGATLFATTAECSVPVLANPAVPTP